MSTKIYNAYKFVGKDIHELVSKLKDMRREHIAATVYMLRGTIRDFSGSSMDELSVAYHKLADLVREDMKSGVNSSFNLTAAAVIYSFEGQLYIQFFGLDKNVIISPQYFIDFHYQNQVDRPDDITDIEWAERERVWDSHDIPSKSGLTFSLVEIGWDVSVILRKVFKID